MRDHGSGSVLLVEDEALIRMMIADMIEDLGYHVVAEAGGVGEGKSLVEVTDYDLAVLDINVAGINVQPVAEMVAARGLPLLFISGYEPKVVSDQFRDTPVLTKPFVPSKLKEATDNVLASSRTGFAVSLHRH